MSSPPNEDRNAGQLGTEHHCDACSSPRFSRSITVRHHDEPSRSTVVAICDRCGTGRTVASHSEVEVREKNDALYEGATEYNQRVHCEEYRRRCLDDATWVMKRIGAPRWPSLRRYLDVGCSAGGMMEAFSELGFDVYGIEPSDACRHAPPNLASRIQRCYLGQESSTGPFGIISAFHVLEHVPQPS